MCGGRPRPAGNLGKEGRIWGAAGGTGQRCGGRGCRRAGRWYQKPENGKRVPNPHPASLPQCRTHSHPGEPRKILSQLVGREACPAGTSFSGKTLSPRPDNGTRQRFRRVNFALQKGVLPTGRTRTVPIAGGGFSTPGGDPKGQAGGRGCPAHPPPAPRFPRPSQPRKRLSGPWLRFWSEPLCAGPVLEEIQ